MIRLLFLLTFILEKCPASYWMILSSSYLSEKKHYQFISPTLPKTFLSYSYQHFFILRQELSLVILSCIFHMADIRWVLSYLKLRLSCFDLTGNTAVSLSGGRDKQDSLTCIHEFYEKINKQHCSGIFTPLNHLFNASNSSWKHFLAFF